MSNFIVPDEKLNRNPRAAVKFDNDVLQGFIRSADNNQPRQALEYLKWIMILLDERITAEENAKAEEAGKKPAKAKATATEE